MKTFELTEELLTGIDEIDGQHRKLISWANDLTSDQVVADDKRINEALNNLDGYVAYHFQSEEEAMHKYGYDLLEKHKKQHERLTREVSELFARAEREGASKGLMAELQYMFADWIQLHIKEWDQPFAAFLKSRNVSPPAPL